MNICKTRKNITKNSVLSLATIAVALVLSGCGKDNYMGGMELSRNARVAPTGSEFNKALFAEYMKLSREEFDQGDYRDSDAYALRARATAQGSAVEPEAIAAREIPASKVPELASYRARLVAALNNGSKDRIPRDAAQAQGLFDCWMEQQEEDFQPDDIAECRAGFLTALAKIEVVPVAAAAPAPPPPPKPEIFTIYFDLNKSTLTDAGQREVERIMARARAIGARSVVVDGYADRLGSDAYNLELSEKRSVEIVNALRRAGVNVAVNARAYGESRPEQPTEDGVAEARNRRALVTIIP